MHAGLPRVFVDDDRIEQREVGIGCPALCIRNLQHLIRSRRGCLTKPQADVRRVARILHQHAGQSLLQRSSGEPLQDLFLAERAGPRPDARQRGRPESAIKVMEEELDSPCTEEMAAFDQFIDYASQSDWEAVVFDAPGKPATIALFGAPGNARGNPRFFAMRTAFPYLAATQGLDQEPLVYRAGDTFELNYLVALYPEMKTAEALSERARRFTSQTK